MTPEGVTIQHPDKLYIGGEWVAPLSGGCNRGGEPRHRRNCRPRGRGRQCGHGPAVAAARHAFDHGPWPTTPPQERMAKLMAMIDLLEPRVPELAEAWTAQVGGLASAAMPMHGGAVMGLRGVAAQGASFAFTEQRKGAAVDTVVLAYEPVGVVVAIAPWNAPFAIMASKIFTALIAGCTVIMKPSPETPLEAYILAEAAHAAGMPPGTVNMVPSHRDAADHLIHSQADRQGHFHRIVRRRVPYRQRLRQQHDPRHVRTGRQERGDHPRRFPHRGRRANSRQHHHRDERTGLRHAQPRHGAPRTA